MKQNSCKIKKILRVFDCCYRNINIIHSMTLRNVSTDNEKSSIPKYTIFLHILKLQTKEQILDTFCNGTNP